MTNVCASLAALLAITSAATAQPAAENTSRFDVRLDKGAVVSLRFRNDRVDTNYVLQGRRLGDVAVKFRSPGQEWQSADTAELADAGVGKLEVSGDGATCRASYPLQSGSETALNVSVGLTVEQGALKWQIELQNLTDEPLEIGDLAVPLPIGSQFGRGRAAGPVILKHSFLSGHGSFIFWMRSNNVGPLLVLLPTGDTKLEYWDTSSPPPDGTDGRDGSAARAANRWRRTFHGYIHSTVAGTIAKEQGCNWRQPHTSLTLAPKGEAGDAKTYGFDFHWADDNDAVRQLLVDNGLIDVHVAPGMTVPRDLFAQIALRTNQPISGVEPEFPADTQITPLGKRGDYQLYQVRFAKLGENRLTVRYGDNRHMHLEFFATEPLETLIKKRGAFIARSQHRDPSKWYDGLISEWNMESQVLLGPDNYDRISGFRIYAVTCDDPGLSKPAFLAAKNAEFPVQREVEALDYYIENFVWGGLQRTTEETYPYGIYGIQDWHRNRNSTDPGRNGQLHIWRCYDYPHIVLMYYSMYRVAHDHPEIETKRPAQEYLKRAYGTALAMFTVPMEVERWSAYRTGFYNELVIVDLIDALAEAGMSAESDQLRAHWERKVRFFVNDRPNLFASEYPFDSTGFESTHALARYAVEHATAEKDNSDDGQTIALADAERFMDRQIAANIFCRGWLEPAYYYLGSDYRGGGGNSYTLTYMSQMGGWSVLDYALHFARDPSPFVRLGYASYLSARALMNTGTAESNYGYWYPGAANDGGAGGGFEPAPFGSTWLGQPHHRGSWYYACEIDLGYCGALRAARTVLADDPIFGRFCFGGDWRAGEDSVQVIPKDGVRRRVHAMLSTGKVHLELDNDRFAVGQPIELANDLSRIGIQLESDNPAEHTARLRVAGLAAGDYRVAAGDRTIGTLTFEDAAHESSASQVVEISFPAGGRTEQITITREAEPRANTFSIVAFDPATGDLGIAVASKVLGVGSIVPFAKANVGAIATQSAANTAYGPDGLVLLATGKSAKETVSQLTEADRGRETRQLGIVDAQGNVAAYSGAKCSGWFGHIEGDHYTVQGNLLAGEEVVKRMAAAFEDARQTEDSELADWLLAALKAGDAAGGDKRGKQSAVLMVVRDKAGYGRNDRYVDLRVEDHAEPVAELERLLAIHKDFFSWAHRNPPRRDEVQRQDDEE